MRRSYPKISKRNKKLPEATQGAIILSEFNEEKSADLSISALGSVRNYRLGVLGLVGHLGVVRLVAGDEERILDRVVDALADAGDAPEILDRVELAARLVLTSPKDQIGPTIGQERNLRDVVLRGGVQIDLLVSTIGLVLRSVVGVLCVGGHDTLRIFCFRRALRPPMI